MRPERVIDAALEATVVVNMPIFRRMLLGNADFFIHGYTALSLVA